MVATVETRTTPSPANQLLAEVRQAIYSGDHERAHKLSTEATRVYPENPEAWLLRSKTTADDEDRLFCLSKASQLDPDHPEVKLWMNLSMWRELEQDPFLAYMDETDQVYFVRNYRYLSLTVPKNRGVPDVYPPHQPSDLAPAYGWLIWALLWLPLAGAGTLVCAPLAMWHALLATSRPLKRPDQVRAVLVVFVALVLMIPALALMGLLLAHLLG